MSERIDHHEGLSDRGLRDLIADQIRFDKSGACMGIGFHRTDGLEGIRASLVSRVKRAQGKLDGFDTGRGLRKVADLLGWNAHYVGDHPFVGTREELVARYPDATPGGDS